MNTTPSGDVTFAAAPFATTSPSVELDPLFEGFGTSLVYDRRGRVLREVAAHGRDPGFTETYVQGHVFVRSFEYEYENGQLATSTYGADENNPSSAHEHMYDQSWRTALGREVRRARRNGSRTRIDLVDQRVGLTGSDGQADPLREAGYRGRASRLGERVRLPRAPDLPSPSPACRPAIRPTTMLGTRIESWWDDDAARKFSRATYDGFGRISTRELLSRGSDGEVLESHDSFHYDTHSGIFRAACELPARSLVLGGDAGVGSVYYGYDDVGRPRRRRTSTPATTRPFGRRRSTASEGDSSSSSCPRHPSPT